MINRTAASDLYLSLGREARQIFCYQQSHQEFDKTTTSELRLIVDAIFVKQKKT